jgi:integrase
MAAVSFQRFVTEALGVYAPPLRKKGTFDKVRQVLLEFAALPGVARTSDLNPVAIAAWVRAHPGRKPVTAHGLLRSLRSACTFAKSMGWLKADPFDFRSPAGWLDFDAGGVDQEPGPDRHKSAAEVAAVLALLDRESAAGGWEAGRLRALVYTYAFTGMRKSEALGLLRSDVDLPARLIRVRRNRKRRLKNQASAAALGVSDELAAVLGTWLPRSGGEWAFPGKTLRGPWLHGGPGVRALDQVKAAGLRAGVPGLTILSFRHTLATLAEGWAIGELELQRWLRHARRRTQDGYRGDGDLDVIRRTAAKIRFGPAA